MEKGLYKTRKRGRKKRDQPLSYLEDLGKVFDAYMI